MHNMQTIPAEAALYVVATPIGNLGDITLRAIEILKNAEAIAAEDTRVAQKLLAHLKIKCQLISLHEHNESSAANRLIELLTQGKSVAMISDAGTPAISDPGALAVERVRTAGFRVEPIPGPNAAIAALSVSGMSVVPFSFQGFLPAKKGERGKMLESLKERSDLLVFYEAPHRIVEAVASLVEVFGPDREICIARELTKLFEQVHRCRLGDALSWLQEDADRRRGEFVLVVEGAVQSSATPDGDADRILGILLRELPLKQAVTLAAEISGARKNALYEQALQWRAK